MSNNFNYFRGGGGKGRKMRKVERCTEWGPLRPMLHGTGVCWTITDMGSNRNLVWKQLKLVVIIECLGGGGVATTLNDRFGV